MKHDEKDSAGVVGALAHIFAQHCTLAHISVVNIICNRQQFNLVEALRIQEQ